ncbi:DUF1236 domain-containing protein [Pseudooceanicola nanhaiensis]|uniref:DUF1236 domain-containing protein n=1 Tax=Pseudooceanicola nanhaiensis TaxID=375761 RepID=UPI001CD567A0|nr:DUF1236 domain-containing protein [Pseudooceanicola nanhaiensis]MCA0922375.1 SH3 domain-containing protein [Pseudooceanicola nanhaiensis]
MFGKLVTLTTAGVLATTTAAFAATDATAVTDLNLRAGPSTQSAVIGVIPNQSAVSITECYGTGEWCEVSYNGQEGWAYSPYLTAALSGTPEPVVVYDNRQALDIQTVEKKGTKEEGALVGGAAAGALAASLAAGPIGVAGAAIAGAVAGSASQPGDEVTTYVRQNPTQPVYLNGEVVVGAGVPQEVTLQPVPESDYSYVYMNGVPAIVNPADRTVVQVVR